ncbi:uncharacterized protein LOC130613509 [Hydractinia symbiolongicarpus]|uniref:uncharacterized protein LOC130613509 n=1 Tax=Hydractinia symbiolongicarpus TaxID=13093 RepID=UPI00255152AF|nr:uncharacterized protein LOC130613509 [Hydractinia symbiolongicarpus]
MEIFIHEMDYYIFDIFSQGESGESSSSLHRYPSYSEFHEALDSYEVKTKTHYTVLSETKDFNKDQCLQEVLEASSSPQICWQLTHKEDSLPIHFNGISYIWLGTKKYQCHQGKDRGISIKKKYKQDREEKLRGDHPECVRTRKLAQHTKKLDCPVVFSVKKLLLFPGYKIEKDSKWNRTVASKKLKGALVKYHMKDDQLTIESRLQYITTFPTETHSNHNMGEAAGLIEPLDQRVANYMKQLIRGGCRKTRELKLAAAEFVKNTIFSGRSNPEKSRRRFTPSRKKIKNLITSVKIETRYSKIDQENVESLKNEWSDWADIYFSARLQNKQVEVTTEFKDDEIDDKNDNDLDIDDEEVGEEEQKIYDTTSTDGKFLFVYQSKVMQRLYSTEDTLHS